MKGTVHPKETMFLRMNAGTASADDLKYEMSYSMSGTPIVRSEQTGKWWSIGWQQLIELAVEAGIDKEEGAS